MITHADKVILRQLVGPATFARGSAYAARGAVVSCEWEEDASRVLGEIQGAASRPYSTSVKLTRSRLARLSALEATCTCPVGFNCKHAVALLLANTSPSSSSSPFPSPTPTDRRAPLTLVKSRPHPTHQPATDWERPVQALLGGGDAAVPAGLPAVALQFELVPARDRPGPRRGSPAGDPRIQVRPVVPGRAGNWVKTGVSWSTLDHLAYRRPESRDTADQLLLLQELLALSRAGTRTYRYSYPPEDVVWLETVNSRRLWDLLGEARDLHLPLLRSTRPGRPVDLRTSPAEFTIDVTRSRSGLRLRPQVEVDDQPVPVASSLLIGKPAHGIAWWDDPAASSSAYPQLSLAAFAAPVDDTMRGFLGGAPLGVPRDDETRFLRDFCPTLRRRVTLRSSDESVELPEPAPVTLVLSVALLEGHRLALRWERGSGTAQGREPLWDEPGGFGSRTADAMVEAATRIVGPVPGLVELTPFGHRLAPTAQLEGMAAVRFVTDLLPALQEIAGVEVEQSGTVPDYRLADDAPVVSLTGSESPGGDWFDLTVTVTVGGEDVPFADLFVALAERRSHLILPSGTYICLDRAELRELAGLIAEARALHDAPTGDVRLSRFQASLWEDLRRLGIVTAQAEEWEASVRALAEATECRDYDVPGSFSATLRPYQHQGFNWLAFLYEHRLGGLLADDMGLGKTLEALALMCHTKSRGLTDTPYLVVAPTSVVQNWVAECARFAPGLRAVMVTETMARRSTPLAGLAAGADVVVTSYSLFRLEYADYEAIAWAGLFLDEAQFAKNRASQAYRRAKMLPVSFKVAMTGTPMENNLMELWSLLSITAPGLFSSPDRFAEYYRVPIEKHADGERLDQLRRRLRPLMLRRTKDQVERDLPDKQEQVLEMDLNPRHKKMYQTYLQRERQKVLGLIGDMTKNRFEIFRSLTLLRQASLDISLVDDAHAGVPSTKLDALMEMLGDIVTDGHRVLVFSQFTRFLALARHRIRAAGIDHCYLDGRTRNRPAVITEFRTGAAPVFLISLKAGGFGLNLTEADYCILLDPWWNPASEAQAVDRVHRIGQTRKVMVYRLVAKGTIEEKVMALKARKAALFANVIDAGGFESGALTAADIRALLS